LPTFHLDLPKKTEAKTSQSSDKKLHMLIRGSKHSEKPESK